MSDFSENKKAHKEYGHDVWVAGAVMIGLGDTYIGNVCRDVRCTKTKKDGLAKQSELRVVVEDLEKVLVGLKQARPDNWTTVMNANGDLMAVPILAALVQGYAELAKLGE